MKIKIGDAIEALKSGEIEVLIHGCNCFNTMGAGIARALSEALPVVYHADQQTTYGDYNKLGIIDKVYCVPIVGHGRSFVINAYTQYQYAGPGRLVDYTALKLCLKKVAQDNILASSKIGLPLIGCGLAGGEWPIVKLIIEDELGHLDVTIYALEKDRKRVM